jgi:LAO/AO transport system kinase
MADLSSTSALSETTAPGRVSSLNPNLRRSRQSSRSLLSVEDYVCGIQDGNRVVLSRAITLLESTKPEHRERARAVLDRCLPETGDSLRVGITGVPGVGKSTFIEALGTRLADDGHRIAVLAIDPSSERSKGSILGDKTRMGALAAHENVYIRPSPTSGSLGGVARTTRETILLCEAAGFNTIFVETVGVGQSEITVHSMVDMFLLLALAGAGDELQGIKRGIMEMADALVINKADGSNRQAAQRAQRNYQNALHLFPPTDSGWSPPVLTCSAQTGHGIDAVWDTVSDYRDHVQASGHFEARRHDQARYWMQQTIEQRLVRDFFEDPAVNDRLPDVRKRVLEGTLSAFAAADRLLDAYRQAPTGSPQPQDEQEG